MGSDAYSLFTEFHRLFVRGVRQALRDRLQSAYGQDWFHRGVLIAVSEAQRTQLDMSLEKAVGEDWATLIDVGHFGRVVRWNHAAVFSDAFPEIDHALVRFRFLVAMRNEWAHIPAGDWSMDRVFSAISAMQSILVSLRCREALEVARLMNERDLSQSNDATLDQILVEADSTDDEQESVSTTDEFASANLGLWHTLQSYLVTEAFMVPVVSPDGPSDPLEGKVNVTVRVTNIAPASEDRPVIIFQNIRLSVKPDRGGNSRDGLGELIPGQMVERQYTLHAKEVAQFEYHVDGQVDTQRFFGIQQNGTLPVRTIRAVLDKFSERFDCISINEPLDQAVASLTAVNPTMTLTDAAKVRGELEQVAALIDEKRTALGDLSREFFLDRESSLGAQVREVVILLEGLGGMIRAVDEAISTTNLEEIKQAVENFEQSQMSVLQVQQTIRNLLST